MKQNSIKEKIKWIIIRKRFQRLLFALFILCFLSCESSRSLKNNEAAQSNCIEKKAVELLPEDYQIKKSKIKEIKVISFLIIDSLCNGLFIIDYKFTDKTGLSLPVLKSGTEIVKYQIDDLETNIARLELFKQKFDGIIKLEDYKRIKKRFLVGALRAVAI